MNSPERAASCLPQSKLTNQPPRNHAYSMRIRLTFEDPLPPYRCWYEVPTSCATIRDLQRAIRKGFNLDQVCKTIRLDLDGFFLLPVSSIAGSIKEGDLLQVMIRRKSDNLPPRSLPVADGVKRSRKDIGPASESRDSPRKKRAGVVKVASSPSTRQKPKKQQQLTQPNNNNNGRQYGQKLNSNTGSTRTGTHNRIKPNTIDCKQHVNTTNAVSTSRRRKGPALSSSPLSAASTSKQNSILGNRTHSTASVTKSKALTSSISSESSNSSSSDSSSSDSSSSNSNSDSSSDSDSDSDFRSSAPPAVVKSVSNAAPGMGLPRTQSRNERRKKTKEYAALVKSSNAGCHATSVPKQNQADLCNQIEPVSSHFSVPIASSNSVQNQAAAKVIITTVELNDSKTMSRASSAAASKRVVRSNAKNTKGVHIENESAKAMVESMAVKGDASLDMDSTCMHEDDSEADSLSQNYEDLPRLEGNPNIGDMIAYKTLEMDASYSPIISDFKEATVMAFSAADSVVQVQLARKFREPYEVDSDGRAIMGKFDVYDEEEIERARRGMVTLDFLSLADCRVIAKKQ